VAKRLRGTLLGELCSYIADGHHPDVVIVHPLHHVAAALRSYFRSRLAERLKVVRLRW
jgi:hypothetical protein